MYLGISALSHILPSVTAFNPSNQVNEDDLSNVNSSLGRRNTIMYSVHRRSALRNVYELEDLCTTHSFRKDEKITFLEARPTWKVLSDGLGGIAYNIKLPLQRVE